MSREIEDFLSADTADVLPADTTDVSSAGAAENLSGDASGGVWHESEGLGGDAPQNSGFRGSGGAKPPQGVP